MKVRIVRPVEVRPEGGLPFINLNAPRTEIARDQEWCCDKMSKTDKWVGNDHFQSVDQPWDSALYFYIVKDYYGYERGDSSGSVRIEVSFCPWCGENLELEVTEMKYRTVWKEATKRTLEVERVEFIG